MHLQELERLFEEICSQEMHKESLFDSALEVCPDLVLHHSDEYMATLINNLSIEQGHRNIFVICGYGQSKSIPFHLYHNPRAFQIQKGEN
jgi:hypothetical protein